MAALVLILLLLVAVALVVVSLRALIVACEAMRLTYRLKLAARMLPDPALHQSASSDLTLSHSSFPPIRVLYSTKRVCQPGAE
ncbi:MAG TPA: hypothetical protein VKT82_09895 [Ktedonobacterales bacterium]|nr:hypothetical protein [Ktedonobacterales bacterium]